MVASRKIFWPRTADYLGRTVFAFHPTSTTAAIVVSRRCFIWLQLSIHHPSCRRVCGSPPKEGRIGAPVEPRGIVVQGKDEKCDMSITVHNVPTTLALVIMPNTFVGIFSGDATVTRVPGSHPRPIALNDFRARSRSNLCPPNGSGRGCSLRCQTVRRHMFDTKPINGPHREITVSPPVIATGI